MPVVSNWLEEIRLVLSLRARKAVVWVSEVTRLAWIVALKDWAKAVNYQINQVVERRVIIYVQLKCDIQIFVGWWVFGPKIDFDNSTVQISLVTERVDNPDHFFALKLANVGLDSICLHKAVALRFD